MFNFSKIYLVRMLLSFTFAEFLKKYIKRKTFSAYPHFYKKLAIFILFTAVVCSTTLF